ncbi:MAG: hypothetical protein EOO14_09050 [Chitinophagaceae bacterium]|nr:MAG: hypothetical protein EOO14_09050 [Chitinophagaceae bacterium]
MNLTDFSQSLSDDQPPKSVSIYLQSLWWDGKGDWEKSHQLIQDLPDKNAAWIHAYLHRKEGDVWNADYWYKRAGKKRPASTLEEEWAILVEDLLA